MKLLNILILLMVAILIVSGSYADIYTWTDENGVRHYSDAPPADADDAKAVFPEYQYDEKTDKKQKETEQKQLKSLIKEIEAEDARDQAEKKRKAQKAEMERKPTQQELIAAEKERLEKRIAYLEEQPLEYFGSQRNKIVRIGYYHYRIQELMQDPDKYFSQPESFEGNVKNLAPEDSNHASGAAGY
ncbi:MAG: DUF4124 domain-containing protein [Deltaproteobacteria bacterium]|jgi:hypothetical protein|nr:DUF4124 domain-containing protein [Deltaproteobacteria bacterium]